MTGVSRDIQQDVWTLPERDGPKAVSRASLAGLDWLNFFIANVQTGFGPFIAVYLTIEKWTQVDIGLVLTIGSLIALAGQIPCGALVDATQSKREVAAASIVAIAASALMLAVWPVFAMVLAAEIFHGIASCFFGPTVAAIALGLVGHAAFGERLGRNVRFASVGNGIAAALMGACGQLVSTRAVFFLTAGLAIPALIALQRIRPREIDNARSRGAPAMPRRFARMVSLPSLAANRPLLIFSLCLLMFHLGNAAMLPFLGSVVTMRSADWATALIAACIVVPQIVVAALSPWIGRQAERWGRHKLLLLGFAALPLRGVLFALVSSPYLLVLVQLLDGIAAAVLGVMVPLVVADITRGTGRFNLALGVVGTAIGIGASLSTVLAGAVSDSFGSGAMFITLACVAAGGLAMVATLMPETRPQD